MTHRSRRRGQALVEFALVLPLFVVVLSGVMIFGVGVFYQQQLTNAAREAARYAAIHSATSQCPTTSWLAPQWSQAGPGIDQSVYYDCDPPGLRWPQMTAYARSKVVGLNASNVYLAACWSGYWEDDSLPASYDAGPAGQDGVANTFHNCTVGGIDPRNATASIGCPPPLTTSSDDKASDLAASSGVSANEVTVYACYRWTPPFLGSFFGGTVTMRAVVTEAMQHQQ